MDAPDDRPPFEATTGNNTSPAAWLAVIGVVVAGLWLASKIRKA